MGQEIKVKIEPHFAGDYRIEYDGKYIELYGKDKNYVDTWAYFGQKREGRPEQYISMYLMLVKQIRNVNPVITKVDDDFIYIELK